MVTVPMVTDFRCSSDVCVGDVNVDDLVDVNDLLDVIEAWGPCISCDADLVFDGVVDVEDLLALIAGWGPCV
jgi:hypothetical protein